MAFDQSKDFRSAAQSSKRFKEHKAKWSMGARPSAGVRYSARYADVLLGGSESQQEKIRPEKLSHHRCQTHNVVKFRKGRIDYAIPQSHSRAKCEAIAELNDPSNVSRSIHEMLPSHSGRRTSEVDNILYSFDRSETPGKPLSLDVFVKTNPRETEKLVEKEYEILDGNGEPLRGRKARRDLRRKSPKPIAEEPGTIDDDGFELV